LKDASFSEKYEKIIATKYQMFFSSLLVLSAAAPVI